MTGPLLLFLATLETVSTTTEDVSCPPRSAICLASPKNRKYDFNYIKYDSKKMAICRCLIYNTIIYAQLTIVFFVHML